MVNQDIGSRNSQVVKVYPICCISFARSFNTTYCSIFVLGVDLLETVWMLPLCLTRILCAMFTVMTDQSPVFQDMTVFKFKLTLRNFSTHSNNPEIILNDKKMPPQLPPPLAPKTSTRVTIKNLLNSPYSCRTKHWKYFFIYTPMIIYSSLKRLNLKWSNNHLSKQRFLYQSDVLLNKFILQ